jgi:mannosyltransferase
LRHHVIALGIVVLGLVLRLWELGGQSFSWDEGFSVRWAAAPLFEMIAETQREDFNPPLYYALLHGFIAVFGSSEFSLRLFSALAGTAAIACVYFVARSMRGPRAGLIAAFLFAGAAYQIRYAQDARCFALLVFLSALALHGYLARRFVLFAVAAVLASYTHIYGVFVFFAGSVAWPAHDRKDRRALVILSIAAVALIPLAIFAMRRAAAVESSFWIQTPPTPRIVLESFHAYTDSWILLGLLGASALVGFVVERRGRTLLLAMLVLPHAVPFVASHLVAPIYQSRYAIASTIPLYVWAAAGLDFLFAESRRRTAYLFAAMIAAVSAWKIAVYFRETQPGVPLSAGRATKAPWRDVAAYLDRHALPGDLFVYNGHSGGGANLIRHYSKRTDRREAWLPLVFNPADETSAAALANVINRTPRVWFVFFRVKDPSGLLAATMRAAGYEHEPTPFNGERTILVELWRSRP